MKMRLQSNSIRLRLKRSEVDQLVKTGRVEEKIIFGSGEGDALSYILELSLKTFIPQASRDAQSILVQIPAETAFRWARSEDVGIETMQSTGSHDLQILIEKDFACLNGTEQQNADTYPNPKTKC